MMPNLRIKLGQARNYSSESRSTLTQNYTSNKKPIQFVREKIDNNLKKAYQKLKLDGRVKVKQSQTPQLIQKSIIQNKISTKDMNSRDNINHICLKRRNHFSANSNYLTPNIKQSKRILEKDEITLVDNKDVMEYIHLIYEAYNIKDPLNGQEDVCEGSSMSTIQKNKKDVQLDEEYTLNSARTMKQNAQNIAEISEFDVDHQGKIKKTANKKNNKILITLRSNSVHKNGLRQIKQFKTNPLLVFKEKNNNYKFNNNVNQYQIRQNIQNSQPIPSFPIFRYCLACEKPIFQQNIRKHQSQCKQLKLAYTFSFSKIIQVLDEKIQRIIRQIENQIINVSTDSLNKRFQHLQSLIKTWTMQVFEINTFKSSHRNVQQRIDKQFRNQFEVIKHTLDNSFYDNFQLLNRLSWFTKLRLNIIKQKTLL